MRKTAEQKILYAANAKINRYIKLASMTIDELTEFLMIEREINRSGGRVRSAKYRANNPDRHVEVCRNSRKKRMASILKYNAEYSRSHPWLNLVNQQNRRARIKSNGGKLSKNIVYTLMHAQDGICNYCSITLPNRGFHIDHIMPLALGGAHSDENIQLLCAPCNLRKNAKHPDVFARQMGLVISAQG